LFRFRYYIHNARYGRINGSNLMNMNRRTLGLTLVALAASPAKALQMSCGGGGWEDDPSWWPRGTTVQPLAQQVMAGFIRRLHPDIRNATREQHEAHIRAIFPQVVEQNFVRLRPAALRTYMRHASDRELRELALLYGTDLNAQSRQGRLLPMLAVRASDADLLRWGRAFGTMPVYEALARFAPQKLPGFERGMAGGLIAVPALDQGFQPNVDMTITRIYQGFRAAPIGATSIPAAIYQTATYSGIHLSAAFSAGYAVGTGISYLLTNYAPSVHDAIGGTLYEMMQGLSGLTGIPISQAQEEATYGFQVTDYAALFEQTGGDYGAVEEWSIAAGYGGTGC
jgi:hypothetical protein